MNHYIYKLNIIDTPYFYYGSSGDKYRYGRHYNRCYNQNSHHYNYKLYKKIRELVPIKGNYVTKIKMNKILERLTEDEAKIGENCLVNKHINNEYCLNMNRVKLTNDETISYRKNYREVNKLILRKKDKIRDKIRDKKGKCDNCKSIIIIRKMQQHYETEYCKLYKRRLNDEGWLKCNDCDKIMKSRLKRHQLICNKNI